MKTIILMLAIVILGVSMIACGASQNKQGTQYVPVPAITGQWTIAATTGGSTSTVRANLVSVPCNSIDSLPYDPSDVSWASSCSVADNFAGLGSITGTEGNFYYPPQILVVATGADAPSTTMNFYFLECSGTSTECYATLPEVHFDGQGILTSPSSNFSGNWQCSGSGPCSGQTGTFIATQ